jgi:2-polyprenyl-6-methoxyphenol hydroxylase-like FAD-dependent oxidoreductase
VIVVYERAPALEAVGAGIVMAPNALKALDTIDVGERVRALGALQGEAGITRPDGRWLSRTSAEAATARDGDPTVLVHRAVLLAHVVVGGHSLAHYTAARLERTTMIARQSRRIGRLTQLSHPVPVFLRDAALRLACAIGPAAVLRQMDPVLSWGPP